jgi:predicted ATPase/class 3 adenylate cyclase/Tfp pilus assembly protein PilF
MTTRALVFTDVVDSTRLVERLGDERAAEVWAQHDRRARELIAAHRGREIDRTDGFFLLFDDALDAVRFALDYHQALRDIALEARVGLHVGPVTLRENAQDDVARGAKRIEVEGLAKPLAARVMGLARGGQALITGAVRDALVGALPAGVTLEPHGHYRLKGLEDPVEIFEIGMPGTTSFAPPPDADKAYRVIRANGLWSPMREIRHNLPAERDSFVGRTAELRALAARLDGGARLVTVLGPGGTGKTRLVRRYGRSWLGDWPGGVYFCDLSEARSLDGIHFAVSGALGVPLGREDPAVQLGHAIAGRGRCLVILDNFEQVVPYAAATVGRWLDLAEGAAFMVTSRERLHLQGEEALPLEPLPVEEDAIELFAARARSQRPDFVLDDGNRESVAEVVRLLDGLPLAIELAAARVRILSPAQLIERMRDRFALLAGTRGQAARQATLRAAIDWSWDLLAPWEQGALAQCAIFEGGFTLEAAEVVLDLSMWADAPPVMDIVQALADKSLLRTWVPTRQARYDVAEPYFGMYLSIHEYAKEKLLDTGLAATRSAEERHGHHFAGHGRDDALDALSQQGGIVRRRALALELDNLVAACRRAVSRGDRDTAIAAYRAAWQVLTLQGPLSLGASLGQQVEAMPDLDDVQKILASVTLAQALRRTGRVEEAHTYLEQALALCRAADNLRREGWVLIALANLLRERGRTAQATEHFNNALDLALRTGARSAEGDAHSGLGLVAREQGRTDDARMHFDAALAIARELADRREEGVVLGSLGLLESERGNVDAARGYLESAHAIACEFGDRQAQGVILANLGQLHTEQGRIEEASASTEMALSIHREVGNRRLEAIALGNLGTISLLQGRVAEAQACYEGAITIARQVGNRRHESFLLCSLGILRHGQGRIEEAGADYEAALAISRGLSDRRGEGIALSRLGRLHCEQGRLDEAGSCYDLALAHARAAGYRRLEGVVLGGFGELLARRGRPEEGLVEIRAGEALLREIGDREELARLLCGRGIMEARLGARDLAREALAESESIANAIGSSAGSELASAIAALREALA